MHSSMVQADASNKSVVNKEFLKRYRNKSYQTLESRLKKRNGTISDNNEDIPKLIFFLTIIKWELALDVAT